MGHWGRSRLVGLWVVTLLVASAIVAASALPEKGRVAADAPRAAPVLGPVVTALDHLGAAPPPSETAPPVLPPTSVAGPASSDASAVAASVRYEAESLGEGEHATDDGASGGQFVRATSLSTPPLHVGSGPYVLEASFRAEGVRRVDLTVSGVMVGSYGTSADWQQVSAVLWLAEGDTVGLASVSTDGQAVADPVDVDWLSLTPTSAGHTVHGNQVVDGAGAPLHYRGFTSATFLSNGPYNGRYYIVPVPIDDVWRWGADVVRLHFNQELWLADCPAGFAGTPTVTTYRAALKSTVDALTSRGLTVMLSLAQTERGQATGCNAPTAPALKEMADTRSLGLWTSVANAYKDNPLVAFDLYNEPHDISESVWRDGGAVSYVTRNRLGLKTTVTYQAVGMQAMYNAVRSTGATNLIYVAGAVWGTVTSTLLRAPLDGWGIVASTHLYCNTCAASDPHMPPDWDTYNTTPAVLARFPVVVTETGWHQSQDRRFTTASLSWADAKADGWIMYAFATGTDPYCLLQPSATLDLGGGQTTRAPTEVAAPGWNALASNRADRGYPALPR